MAKKALKSGGEPVFFNEYGEECERFPKEDIVRRHDTENTEFIVYGFVGTDKDYEEREWSFEMENSAIAFATSIYGRDDVDGFKKDGEVYEVEVHEVDK